MGEFESALGYAGVTVWNPQGKLIGRIRLPEVAPICVSPAQT